MSKINGHGERLTKRQTQALRTKLGRQAKKCAAYDCDACPFELCVVEIQADRIAANTCPYFIKHVLPENPKLEADYLDALPASHPAKPKRKSDEPSTGKRCATCFIEFKPRSNRQKYCSGCADERRKEKEAERMRKKRLEDAIKQAR
ncbi:hypothetical protein [Sporosarcina sp. D27]|uniref:hypothetical protein n=1 Tax=Sporosarcina sp. D27 TaxID=1382305 RepID=UPI000471B655|nr:hypothetical protein [Sporosarcina sp. D27]